MISEAKMKIVIDNYFRSECNVDTSIHQAFEKGFRIGAQKGATLQPERKEGRWKLEKVHENEYGQSKYQYFCSECGFAAYEIKQHFCHNCGVRMSDD